MIGSGAADPPGQGRAGSQEPGLAAIRRGGRAIASNIGVVPGLPATEASVTLGEPPHIDLSSIWLPSAEPISFRQPAGVSGTSWIGRNSANRRGTARFRVSSSCCAARFLDGPPTRRRLT